jgi:AcrR family transcriptional regulator
MRDESTDRRSLRTRSLLSDALAELMLSQRYEAISVQQITERANVGRSTFYAHFTDKDDLLAATVRRMVGELQTDEPGARNTLAPSIGLFHHVADHAQHYLMLSRGRHLSLFLDALQSELTTMFAARLAPRLPGETDTRVPVRLLAAMLAGMLITAMRTWVESGMSVPAEQVNRSYVVAAEAALRAGLRPVEATRL